MIRNLLNKFKKKNNKKTLVETDSVPEPPRPNEISNFIPCEHSAQSSSVMIPQVDLNSIPSPNNFVATPGIYANQPSPNSVHSSYSIPHSVPAVQLSVSNSHGFHIGDVHNVTVSNGSTANFNNESGLAALGKPLRNLKSSPLQSTNYESLEYIYDKIKDWEISLISEHVEDGGSKAIGAALNLNEEELLECVAAADGKNHLAIQNILRQYLNKFPDTSLGFIVSILRETSQIKAIAQIAKVRL